MTAEFGFTVTAKRSLRPCAAICLFVAFLGSLVLPGSAAEPPDWEKTIQAFEEQDRVQPPKPGGVLFLGSSTIRLWNTAKAFPEFNTINRGFGVSQRPEP